ncbi:Periplasmic zinc-binding protein TroA [Chlamydia avium]|uniref:Periplasmic solute binding family protein n=1 Tax=Chlamydia avium TaxID=1457141 RepID=A0ABN0MRU8_9CHLA|nr:zinc ABC transporter substrate-binding protein [Chlamydia avium]EPP36704.1 periplasmic solute binding family protein [Chlamydia psittaci 10_743_SC13]EPP38211.1 periplasmic solute binding family protein [Chlamydia avium]VVT42723.1 Periplasmic zinc-binding protein TroA [Chlamydia avium]
MASYLFKKVQKALCLVFIFVITGCSPSQVENSQGAYVLSTNRMLHDCVSKIVGNKVGALVLIDGSIDPHTYEMVKGDEDKLAVSRLIFCNGLGLEGTASLRKHLEGNPKVINIGSLLLEKHAFVPLEEDGVYDPHIWLDISIWREGVKEITEALIREFPEWKEEFTANASILLDEMQALDDWAERCLLTIPEESRYLVSGHNAFSYFTRRYLASDQEVKNHTWVKRCISPEGISPEAQISIRDIMLVAEYIQEHNVQVVFPEDTLNQDALKKITACLKKGHEIRLSKNPLYSDNVQQDYFHTFKHNVRTIVEELGGTIFE